MDFSRNPPDAIAQRKAAVAVAAATGAAQMTNDMVNSAMVPQAPLPTVPPCSMVVVF